jgi:hypothetical protein
VAPLPICVKAMNCARAAHAAKPEHPALVSARERVIEDEPAISARKEGDIFAARSGDLDHAVADHGAAAADDSAAGNLDEPARSTGEQRTCIGEEAVDLGGAAALRQQQPAGGNDTAAATVDRRIDIGAAGEDEELAATADVHAADDSAGKDVHHPA